MKGHKRTDSVWFHFYEIARKGKFIETENILEFTRGWVAGGGTEFLFGGLKSFGNGQWRWMHSIMNVHLEMVNMAKFMLYTHFTTIKKTFPVLRLLTEDTSFPV